MKGWGRGARGPAGMGRGSALALRKPGCGPRVAACPSLRESPGVESPPPLRQVPAGAPALCPRSPAGKVVDFGGRGPRGREGFSSLLPAPVRRTQTQCAVLAADSAVSRVGLTMRKRGREAGGTRGTPPRSGRIFGQVAGGGAGLRLDEGREERRRATPARREGKSFRPFTDRQSFHRAAPGSAKARPTLPPRGRPAELQPEAGPGKLRLRKGEVGCARLRGGGEVESGLL